MNLINKYKTLLNKYEVNTPLRLSHLLAQLEHESGLNPISENLNYSAERLLVVFPKYFKKLEAAKKVARNPEAIANIVYGGRMGNDAIGDGWKYRARGFLQITGKANYTALSKATGIDYLSDPDKILNEADAMTSTLWFWSVNKLNSSADKDDILKITKVINGGTNGLKHRQELLAKYKALNLEI